MAVRYGRYEVLYKLGQGAMAQVFLARDPVLSRFVAIKVLHADLASRRDVLQRFFNEARTVAAIRSPHVVEVFDFGQEGRDLYLVMEFVDGMSLHGLLRHASPKGPCSLPILRNPMGAAAPLRNDPGVPVYEPLPPAVAAALICQAADGLSIAADHGVVHRDLKPENLMLNTRGYLKISDFGIAHVQDDSLTKTGAVLGSPLYMSPEQARGLKPITAQSDMFSLGAVFYASLAGYPPFRGRSVTELFRRISAEPHLPLERLRPDLDPGLSRLIDTLLSKAPGERGGGPRWLLRHLRDFLMSQGIRDPAEAVAGHLRELGDRGAQTTWKADGRNATMPMTVAVTGPDSDSLSDALRLLPTHAASSRYAPEKPPGITARVATLPGTDLAAPAHPEPTWSKPERQPRKRIPAIGMALALSVLGLGAGLGAWGWAALHGEAEHAARGSDHASAPTGSGSGSVALAPEPGPSDPVGGDLGLRARSPGTLDVTAPGGGAGEVIGAGDRGAISALQRDKPDDAASGTLHANGSGPGARGPLAGHAPADTSGTASAGDGKAGRPLESILVLKSSPPFSEAYLDGQFMGTTPVRIASLAPGRHRLAMKSPRLPGLDTSILVEPGVHALKVRLEDGAEWRVAATSVDGD